MKTTTFAMALTLTLSLLALPSIGMASTRSSASNTADSSVNMMDPAVNEFSPNAEAPAASCPMRMNVSRDAATAPASSSTREAGSSNESTVK